MRILVVADIHGKFEMVSGILESAEKDFDIILAPGDFTDIFNVPHGFSQENIADMVLQKLLALKKPAFCVPGNHDPYEILEIFDDYNVNLHHKVKTFDGVKFLGWGGAPTPFDTPFEPEEDETHESLESMSPHIERGNFILMTHNPAKNTKLDRIASGEHVGSLEIRKFIEKSQPILAVSAHIHESGGDDTIGKTKLFYPGPLYEGYYGIVDVSGGGVKTKIEQAP